MQLLKKIVKSNLVQELDMRDLDLKKKLRKNNSYWECFYRQKLYNRIKYHNRQSSFGTTSIGEYSQVDNLVQIAHNVVIGKHAIIASQVGIAGSTIIGDYVKIGGQAGISGHLLIGDNVTIAGKSGVTKNIQSNKIVAGFPAKDIKDWKREIISISKRK